MLGHLQNMARFYCCDVLTSIIFDVITQPEVLWIAVLYAHPHCNKQYN